MKKFDQYFETSITEGSVMKPDYVVGHKFSWNGKGVAEFSDYKKGDVFEIVPPTSNATLIGKEDGELEKFLKAPDGKVFRLKGGAGYKSASFTHSKEGGSPPSGAEWEDLIVFAYNNMNGKKTDPETEEVAMKFWASYQEPADELAKSLKGKIKGKQLVQTGRGIGKVTLGPHWVKAGAKNTTPKTDIASHDFKEKISLKKAGGSQLASAEKKEAIAIVSAALEDMGEDKKFAQDLVANIEEKMGALISRESVTALSKAAKEKSRKKEVLDFQKKDKQNKELSEMLASYINQDSKTNAKFAKYVVLEASTGNHKFNGSKSKAAANVLVKFTPGKGSVEVDPITSIKDPLIVSYSKKVKPYVAFKKGGNSPAYSALRLGLTEDLSFADIMVEELKEDFGRIMLSEDFLQEGPMDWVRSAGTYAKSLGASAVNKFKAAMKRVWSRVKATLSKIAKMGKQMFASLMNFLGLEISNTRNIPGEIV